MAVPDLAPMPPNLDLPAGYKVRIQALSTADGSAVSGVKVSDFTLTVSDVAGNLATTTAGPYMLVPGPNT